VKSETKVENPLFWLLWPALLALLAGPLFLGHVAVRLLIARMRRRPAALPEVKRDRPVTPAWGSPMLSSRS